MSDKRSKLIRNSSVALSISIGILIFTEAVLRLFGFRFDTRPRYMEFNFPNPHELREIFEPDPVTLWRLRPGVSMGEGIEPINGKGFRGPDFDEQKSEGVIRVVALGDSVTFGAGTSYPAQLQKCLGDGYEVINAGVPGYSSLQGLKLFESKIKSLDPDVLIVMFGWNDHWLAYGYSDARQTMNPPNDKDAGFVEDLRIYQLIHWAIVKTSAGSAPAGTPVMRVSLEEYRSNIESIILTAKISGIRVFLVTAPSALSSGKVPDFLYHLKFIEGDVNDPEEDAAARLMELHESYNDAAREATESTDSELVDISRDWQGRDISGLFRDPSNDVVHPNPEGYRLIAQTLCDRILNR